jgi:hypothetical protein
MTRPIADPTSRHDAHADFGGAGLLAKLADE